MSTSANQDFFASLVIANISPLTKVMQSLLPDIWDNSQNASNFAILYGAGYEMEDLKQRLVQSEANNYLYSPDKQSSFLLVNGPGSYLIEFDVPYVVPPINASIVTADYTDAYIEYTSRYGMVVTVNSIMPDTIKWQTTGFVGAASDEFLGDALYNNFGTIFNFPRSGLSQIDDSSVLPYEANNVFIKVQSISAVQNIVATYDNNGNVNSVNFSSNAPPINVQYWTGIIQPTTVISSPLCTHQLVDNYGNILALLDASALLSQPISAYYPNSGLNIYKTNNYVYITGAETTYSFNRWDQPFYQQIVFEADYQYRKILGAMDKALYTGPGILGIANIVEALITQPYIPQEVWEDNDFRIFENSIGSNSPAYLTYTVNASSGLIDAVDSAYQYDGY